MSVIQEARATKRGGGGGGGVRHLRGVGRHTTKSVTVT